MNYAYIVPDGMADLPMPELDGKTPMEAAKTPNMDLLAETALVGSVLTVPDGLYPGSDVANMGLLGYDPRQYATGRGAIEAAAMDIPMDIKDVAFRCSLVSTDGQTMRDHSSGHITTEEAQPLIELLSNKLGSRKLHFYLGVSYRHIMVERDASIDVQTTPPHDFLDGPLDSHWPVGDRSEQLQQLMYDSMELLANHPINQKRRNEGKNTADMMWLWGQGYALSMPSFLSTFGKTGAIITAVDVVRGLGRATSMSIIDVPGATGYFDTDYAAKGRYALKALESTDCVYVHIEAPDEAGHAGSIEEKIKSIEEIDKKIVGPMVTELRRRGPFRVLIAPDHKTPVQMRNHDIGPVPFLLYDLEHPQRGPRYPFDERAVQEARTHVDDGTRLIRMLFA